MLEVFERMAEMTMLELEKIDLRGLADALEDNSQETLWYLDPRTGEVQPFTTDDEGQPDDHMIPVEALTSRESYEDMEDFAALVRDPRARDLLARAIQGRGAFRRFKDTLFEFPELRQAWFAFHDARMGRRAIRWLVDHGLIDERDAERAASDRPDPDSPELGRPFDPEQIARDVAHDLRELYGDQLCEVILFGSWARGDAHPESDIDLLVVLHEMKSSWDEHKRMDEILWRHSFGNDTVVTALPVSNDDFQREARPVLVNARREGKIVA